MRRSRRLWRAMLIALAGAGALSGCYYDPFTGYWYAYPPYYYPYPMAYPYGPGYPYGNPLGPGPSPTQGYPPGYPPGPPPGSAPVQRAPLPPSS
jgi:hypothetical protein